MEAIKEVTVEIDGGGTQAASFTAKDAVYSMLGSQLRTTLSDGRVVEGKLQCMDRLTNFILADAVETGSAAASVVSASDGAEDTNSTQGTTPPAAQGAQRHLGLVMIPGKHLVSVERLGGYGGSNVS